MTPRQLRRWQEGYYREVEKSIAFAENFNSKQKCKTRQMTKEEYDEVFGEKPVSCHRLKLPERN